MTEREKRALAKYLNMLDGHELQEVFKAVSSEVEKNYWSDDNFFMRDVTDNYIYITRYADGSYYYDCIGKKAYEKYLHDDNCIRIDYKTKDLRPTYGTLMAKGEIYEQSRV